MFDALVQKFRSLGLDREEELNAFLEIVKVSRDGKRGEDIVGAGSFPRHLTVLLTGLTCLYERLEDGSRQIYAFQYPGDFCDLHSYVLPEPDLALAVGALTDCSTGIIYYKDLDPTIRRHPQLGLVLWRASMLEASILRERLLNASRRPALERVAHLLCEQLARREAIGSYNGVIPLTQIDLADAAGLSVVHINRIFQDLRKLGALSENGRAIEVVNRKRLVDIARYDRRYLDMPKRLSQWQVYIEGTVD